MSACSHGGGVIPEAGDLLFAYGTLKTGGQYHHLLSGEGVELLGSGKLKVPYPLILAEYPCLLDQPQSGHPVVGEVYRIKDSRKWALLDHLESHPSEYRRRLEAVTVGESENQAWTYFYLRAENLDPSLTPVPEYRIP